MSRSSVLACKTVSRSFTLGADEVSVLKDIDFDILAGQMVSIVGTSGSGKTTLLNLLAGLDDPTSGDILMAEQILTALNDRKRAALRNSHMGFVFQFHHLLPEFSALDNVLMPCRINHKPNANEVRYAEELLARVGLSSRMKHRPAELSGGERQRVAIARALIKKPGVVLMDEPTGNLDEDTSEQVHNLIRELNRDMDASFVIVTHNQEWAKQMPIQYQLTKGHISALTN